MVTVDTHVIIWEALDPGRLSNKARIEFNKANETTGIVFCDISLWEISMLIEKKRLDIKTSYLEFVKLLNITRNYVFQSITPEIANISANLSGEINSDPADCLIAATSIFLETALITADQNLGKSKSLITIW